MQSLGEIELRAPVVGSKIGVFCMSCFVCPARGGHSSNKYCVYGSILMRFSALFQWIVLPDNSYSLLGGATIFAKFRSKIAKSPKIGGKVCAHYFV